MTMNRRRSLHTLALAATSLAVWPGAAAWAQPSATPLTPGGKAVRILVGFPPGGGSDAIARILSSQGAKVTKEYYFNDHGVQIDRFARSLVEFGKAQAQVGGDDAAATRAQSPHGRTQPAPEPCLRAKR